MIHPYPLLDFSQFSFSSWKRFSNYSVYLKPQFVALVEEVKLAVEFAVLVEGRILNIDESMTYRYDQRSKSWRI